ncbi:hypothetical protein RintRC_3588 [Richelia intracellularis]|nr:hypothetical protein RintRC_3588 [Richelia intracellularis]
MDTKSYPCNFKSRVKNMALLNQGMISLNFQGFLNGFKP